MKKIQEVNLFLNLGKKCSLYIYPSNYMKTPNNEFFVCLWKQLYSSWAFQIKLMRKKLKKVTILKQNISLISVILIFIYRSIIFSQKQNI